MYDVEVKVNEKSPPVNGDMQIKIKTCTLLRKVVNKVITTVKSCKEYTAVPKNYPLHQPSNEVYPGESYTSDKIDLGVPIANVKELSFYWESTDQDRLRFIETIRRR